jgi:hypothetical protein
MKAVEARQILHVPEKATVKEINEASARPNHREHCADLRCCVCFRQRYDLLFKINELPTGSFYLQSKVVRARERLLEDLKAAGDEEAAAAAAGGAAPTAAASGAKGAESAAAAGAAGAAAGAKAGSSSSGSGGAKSAT